MITLKNVCRTLCAICMFTAVGCVDESYRIDEVSTEVTVAEGTTTLPVGHLNKKMLGDLLKDVNIEGLRQNGDGGYEFCFTGTGDDVKIEGIDHLIEIPQINTQFNAEYPTFDIKEGIKGIDMIFDISPKLSGTAILTGQSVPVPAGYTIGGDEQSHVTHQLDYELPAELSGIERIYLKPTQEGDLGARISAQFSLNSLNDINGGGSVTIKLRVPEDFNIYSSEGELVKSGDYVTSEFDFSAGESTFDFVAYVESIECGESIVNGKLSKNLDLEYDLSFEMVTKAGTLTLSNTPVLRVTSEFAFGDADIELNEVTLLDHAVSTGGNISIKDLPEEIVSINELVFAESSSIVLFASGFEWMDEALASSIAIDAWMPEYIVLRDNPSLGYNAEEHKLHTTLSELRKGIEVNLEALSFENGLTSDNGTLDISFAPDIVARIEQGAKIKLSSLKHEGTMTLCAGIKAAELDIQSVSGKFDYTYDYTTGFDLIGVEDLGLEILGLGLSPLFELSICNPFSVDIVANLSILPKFGGEVDMSRALELRDIAIEGKELDGGQVVPTVIVLGTEDRREEYEGSDALFVACDLETVLRGRLPDSIDVALSLATDSESVSTLYAMDEYEFTYDYNFVLPVKLSNELQVRYEDELYFGGESDNPLAMLADYEYVKVGDVAVIAEVATTLPLQLTAKADLLDAEGNILPVKLAFADGKDAIVGSADGVTEAVSTLRLELDIPGDGSIAQLADVAGIRFVLDAGGVGTEQAALRDEQYVAVSLQLELSGGVSADLERLFNAE